MCKELVPRLPHTCSPLISTSRTKTILTTSMQVLWVVECFSPDRRITNTAVWPVSHKRQASCPERAAQHAYTSTTCELRQSAAFCVDSGARRSDFLVRDNSGRGEQDCSLWIQYQNPTETNCSLHARSCISTGSSRFPESCQS